MKKNIFLLIATFLMSISINANAQVNEDKAEDFIKSTTAKGVEEIINANVSNEEKDKRFYDLLNNALDMEFIGQFVLGRNWRSANATQRAEFIKVYRDLNIKTWSKRFNEFKGKNFVFKGTTL